MEKYFTQLVTFGEINLFFVENVLFLWKNKIMVPITRPIPFFEKKGVQIEKKKITASKCPSGYLTHEQFVEQCNKEIDNFCLKHGILQ